MERVSGPMAPSAGGLDDGIAPLQHHAPPRVLSQEGLSMFHEGVGLVLGRWTALQLAIHNEWGGPSSNLKAQQFHADIVSWMAHSKVSRYIDELEDMLDENMLVSFNTETEDGSLEEVAERIMTIHEECLEGNYESIGHLSCAPSLGSHTVSRSQQVDEDEKLDQLNGDFMSSLDRMDTECMGVDNAQLATETTTENMTAEELADGWQVVSSKSRRSRHSKT